MLYVLNQRRINMHGSHTMFNDTTNKAVTVQEHERPRIFRVWHKGGKNYAEKYKQVFTFNGNRAVAIMNCEAL